MVEKVRDALNYKMPISVIGWAFIITSIFGVFTFAEARYFPKTDACKMENLIGTMKIRQDWVLMNQARMMEKMGLTPIELPK